MPNLRPSPYFLRLLGLYGGLGNRAKLRVFQRWFVGAPYEIVETFVPREGTIIDLGCGIGLFSNLLVLKASQRYVVGVDADCVKIAVAQQTVRHRANIEFHCADLREFDLPRCRGAVLFSVLHHLEPNLQLKILQQSFAALEHGGLLIIKEDDTEPRWKLGVNQFIEWMAAGFKLTQGDPVHFYDRQMWADTVSKVGFRLVVSQPIPCWHPWPHCLLVFQKLAGY